MELFWLFPAATAAAILFAAICARKNKPLCISLVITLLLTGLSAAVIWTYFYQYGLTVQVLVSAAAAAVILCLIGHFLWKAAMLRMLRKAARRQESQPLEYVKMQKYEAAETGEDNK